MNRISYFFIILTLALLGSACTALNNIQVDPFQVRSITLQAAVDANEGRPLQVDIAYALNKETLKDMEGFTADGWFTVKGTNLGNWEDHLLLQSKTVDPGARLKITEFPDGYERTLGIVVFARYQQPGLHRLVFNEVQDIDVQFKRLTMESENGKAYFLTSPPQPVRQDRQARY